MKEGGIFRPEKQQVFKNVSLSANAVAEIVNDVAGYIQCQLKEKCKNFAACSIATDDSADVKGIAELSVLVRGVNEDFELVEEHLELVLMKGRTGTNEIVSQLLTLLNKFEVPWKKNWVF
jgi:hypothetical protein